MGNTPSAPTNLIDNGDNTVSYTAGSDNGYSITDYILLYSTDGGSYYNQVYLNSTANPLNIPVLVDGTTSYTIRLLALNSEGASPASDIISFTYHPSLPSAPTSLVDNNNNTISYTPGSTGGMPITDYYLYYSTNSGSTWNSVDLDSSANPLAIPALVDGSTNYLVKLAAINNIGQGPSSELIPFTYRPPPVSLLFGGNYNSYLSINAEDMSGIYFGTEDFTIQWWQYQTDYNSFPRPFQIGTYPGATIGVSIEGGAFIYWNGHANYITNLNSDGYKNKWVHFAISRTSSMTSFYKNGVLMSTISDSTNYVGSSDLTIGNEQIKTNSSAFGGSIYEFVWLKGNGLYTSNFYYPIDSSFNALSLYGSSDLLLPNYYFNGTYGSNVTNTNVTTSTNNSSIVLPFTLPPPPPEAPINLVDNQNNTISYTAGNDNGSTITTYYLYYSIDSGSNWNSIDLNSTANPISVPALVDGSTNYLVKLAAVNISGVGTQSASISFTYIQSVPSEPIDLNDNNNNTISYTPGSTGGAQITDYYLYYSTNSGSTWSSIDLNSTANPLTIPLLIDGTTTYLVKLAAVNIIGQGPSSESISFTYRVVPPTINVGDQPVAIISDGTYVWAVNEGDDNVSKIRISTSTIINTIEVGNRPRAIVSDGRYLWTANSNDNDVSQIDILTNEVINTINVGNDPRGISSDGTYVWTANYDDDDVSQIEISTGNVINTIDVDFNPTAIISNGTYVWVANYDSDTVSKIRISTSTVINTIEVGGGPRAIILNSGYVWTANSNDDNVSQIDILTNEVINTIDVGDDPRGITSNGTYVWTTNSGDNTVSQIEISSGIVINTIPVGDDPRGISSDGTYVWTANYDDDTISKISIHNRIPGDVYNTSDLAADLADNNVTNIHIMNSFVNNFSVITSPITKHITAPNGRVTITYSPIL
jgi:YVTN family beta-propeller protein